MLILIIFTVGIFALLVPLYNIYYFTKDGMDISNATANFLFVVNILMMTSLLFLLFYLGNSIYYTIKKGRLAENYTDICGSSKECTQRVVRKCASTRGCSL